MRDGSARRSPRRSPNGTRPQCGGESRPCPDGFVVGEETALINSLAGRPAKPTLKPPYPFERGLRGAPTLVQNVETLAHLALIARFGPAGSACSGQRRSRARRSSRVSGAVARPGVYEIELGSPLSRSRRSGARPRGADRRLSRRRLLRRLEARDERAVDGRVGTRGGNRRRAARNDVRTRRDRACCALSRRSECGTVRPVRPRSRRARGWARAARARAWRRSRAARALDAAGRRPRRLPPPRRGCRVRHQLASRRSRQRAATHLRHGRCRHRDRGILPVGAAA